MSELPPSAVTPPLDPDLTPPSAVWTRRPPAWHAGLRAAGQSLGAGVAMLYLGPIRLGTVSWGTALWLDAAMALGAGVVATWWTWARRARVAAMLDSAALLPWFLGAGTAFVLGLQVPAALVPRLSGLGILGGMLGGTLAAVGWTSWYLVRWGRRHPARPPSAAG